jgi:hypothetical protein
VSHVNTRALLPGGGVTHIKNQNMCRSAPLHGSCMCTLGLSVAAQPMSTHGSA